MSPDFFPAKYVYPRQMGFLPGLLLPELVNKSRGHPVKSEFQINNGKTF